MPGMFGVRGERGVTKLKRYREVLTAVARYGFAEIADALAAARRFPFRGRARPRGRKMLRGLPTGTRLRMLCEELGPTFVKLGQLLSLRADLLPEDIITELERLQDNVAPVPFQEIEAILARELGDGWRERLRDMGPEPLASASLAQVHRARDASGNELAVKVQRPGVARSVAVDVAILRDIATLLERYAPRARAFRPVQLIEQFTKVLTLELDFTYEGRTMELFRHNFRRDRRIAVPRVYWDICTSKVLSMEYADGIRLSHAQELDSSGLDKRAIVETGARYVLTQVFRDGVYNADPHPGNFIVRRDGVLVPVDFGMVGTLDEEMKQALVDLLLGFAGRDTNKLLRALTAFHMVGDGVDTPDFRQELSRLIYYYGNVPVGHLSVARVFSDLTALIREYHVALPSDLALTAKVLVTLESLGRRLDPGFNIVKAAAPYVRNARASRLTTWRDLQKNLDLLDDTATLLRDLPFDLHEVISRLRSGNLRFRMDISGLEERIRDIDRSINRLAFAIVIAGAVIASSFLSRAVVGPSVFGVPLVGLAGYLVAGVLGVWFLVGIFRSGRL
jgi:ubiquinone biosynthesis protein